LPVKEVQVDEFWGFVFKKEYNLTEEERLLEDIGDMWTFTAIMPETKLLFSHITGKRTYDNARKLIAQIRKRSDGTIPYITSDGYEGYKEAIESIYSEIHDNEISIPSQLCYAQVNKTIEKNRCINVERKLIFGAVSKLEEVLNNSPVSFKVNTAFIERSNLTIRQHNKRVERKSQGFSKIKNFFEKQLSLSIAYYNFCLQHMSLKYLIEDKTVINTPVMEAGLTDHVWTMKELLAYPIN